MKRLQVLYNKDAITSNDKNKIEIQLSDEDNNALSYDVDGKIIVDTSVVSQQTYDEKINDNYFGGIDAMDFMNSLPFNPLGTIYGTNPDYKNSKTWSVASAGNGMLIEELYPLNRMRYMKDDTTQFDPIPGRVRYPELSPFPDVAAHENTWPIYTDPYIKKYFNDSDYVPTEDKNVYFSSNAFYFYNSFTMTVGMDSTVSRHTEYTGSNSIIRNNDGPVMCKCSRSEENGFVLDDTYEDSILYGILANANQQDNTVITLLPKKIYEGE